MANIEGSRVSGDTRGSVPNSNGIGGFGYASPGDGCWVDIVRYEEV